jgi:TolB-like protein/thioredoxin-like negative regulator of GroEL
VYGLLLAACARVPAPQAAAPADIAALEAKRAQTPGDPALNLRLAQAYYGASRYGDARAALATVLLGQPTNTAAHVYLGYTYEGLNQLDSARAVYTALAASHPPHGLARLLAGRLTLLGREEMRVAARLALARESTLTQTPPPPGTVAVMQFRYTGADSTFRPLERGLSALVVTDLARIKTLHLVERDRVQALLDEMRLAESGRVDPATGARSGRLVGAASVVQGQFSTDSGQRFAIQAAVVRASDAQITATGEGADRLTQLFDIEKQVVFQLIDKLGITLTPQERVAISERPTRDLTAFLLYSRGLEAQDRGDYGAAAQNFQAAAQRDPRFGAATQQAQTSQAAGAAAGAPPADLAATVTGPSAPPPGGNGGDALRRGVNDVTPTGAGDLTGATPEAIKITLPPTNPSGICEAAGCQGPPNATRIGTVTIIVKKP